MLSEDDDLPLGRLLSAADAQRVLGIPAATVRTWAHRCSNTGLYSGGLDEQGRPLYWEADLLALRVGLRLRDDQGRRVVRDIGDVRGCAQRMS